MPLRVEDPNDRARLARRASAVAGLPEFERLRDTARDIKNHALANLDFYLEAYEAKLTEAGRGSPSPSVRRMA